MAKMTNEEKERRKERERRAAAACSAVCEAMTRAEPADSKWAEEDSQECMFGDGRVSFTLSGLADLLDWATEHPGEARALIDAIEGRE